MSFFKEKGPYWYFVTIEEGKEVQHYLGKEFRVLDMIAVYKEKIQRARIQQATRDLEKELPKRFKWKDDKGYLRRRRKKEKSRS